MNRMERRIAGRDGPRPGVAACSLPSQTVTSGQTMLSGGSSLYQSSSQNQNQNVRQVNGLEILRNQGDRINRLENKIEQLENMQVMNISGMKRDIDLINSGYNETMSKLKEYIKSLELKIKQLTDVSSVAVTTNIENTVEKAVENQVETSNITLEIIET
jgi:predicted RNase H-like nuclease (RuvC/YqgF family)